MGLQRKRRGLTTTPDSYIEEALELKRTWNAPFPENAKDGDEHRFEGKLYRYNAYEECWNRVDEWDGDPETRADFEDIDPSEWKEWYDYDPEA